KDGFPLYFDIFKGNTFEGHTFLITIQKVIKLLNNPKIIVIADAGMLSKININDLDKRNIGFIVGARVSNLPVTLINKVSKRLKKIDKKASFFDYNNFRLVCQYLTTRANKDRSDRQKQILKAQNAINKPSGVTSRFRFLKKSEDQKYIINQDLILKSEKLEGIKGYITNTKLTKKEIIEKYHNLWKIENCFRVTKSDLEARPIFHHLDETIKAHLIIVFAGLAITRLIEIKTNLTIKKVIKTISKVLTHKVKNIKTGETTQIETKIEDSQLIKNLEIIKSLGH
ncbi:MAG: transposase, partial [Patescibacteria group bacterium]